MKRRSLLGGLALLPLLLGLAPRRAWAIGGVLPELDQPAPDFELDGVAPGGSLGSATAGSKALPISVSLNQLAGRWLVLYFYPKDFTSGCTLEARGFQRDLAAFQAESATVIGVSADDPEAHASFCGSEGLVFPLLSDPGGAVSRRYGSWIAPYSQRHTFLIDPQGILRQRWTAVRPSGHSQEVLAELQRQQESIV
ncbi:MAG: peroxiredoxin [Cyanobium sp.]